jgi:hypothetical protein
MKTRFKALTALAITLAGTAHAAEKYLLVRMAYPSADTDFHVMQEFNRCADAIAARDQSHMAATCDAALALTVQNTHGDSILSGAFAGYDSGDTNKIGIAAAYSNAALAHLLTGDAATAQKLLHEAALFAPGQKFIEGNVESFAKRMASLTPLASN